MSARWKPGDLCSMTWDGNMDGRFPVIRGAGRWYMTDYIDCTSEFLTDEWLEKLTAVDIRRLAVIDPEDAHQVGALADLFFQGKNFSLESQMAALREFANPQPPKPDEPTGLGAVVEDADGDFWVYVGNRTAMSDARIWQHARKELVFDEIAAVRILSAGVES